METRTYREATVYVRNGGILVRVTAQRERTRCPSVDVGSLSRREDVAVNAEVLTLVDSRLKKRATQCTPNFPLFV